MRRGNSRPGRGVVVTMAVSARAIIGGLVTIGAAGVLAATMFAAVPVFPLSLFEHFRPQYAVAALACASVALAAGVWRAFDAATIALLLDVIALAGALPGEGPAPAPGAVPVSVLSINVHTSSTAYAEVAALIEERDPDVIALVEVDARWLDELAPALASYAGRIEHPRADNFGVALYARGELDGEVVHPGDVGTPTIVARLRDGPRVTFVVTHPVPPVSRDGDASHARQLDDVAAIARALDGPRVLLGDLNTTPWSRRFQRLVARSGLRDSLEDRPPEATFPSRELALGVPIDHALVSADVAVLERRVERDVGSDHRPLWVVLAVPAAP